MRAPPSPASPSLLSLCSVWWFLAVLLVVWASGSASSTCADLVYIFSTASDSIPPFVSIDNINGVVGVAWAQWNRNANMLVGARCLTRTPSLGGELKCDDPHVCVSSPSEVVTFPTIVSNTSVGPSLVVHHDPLDSELRAFVCGNARLCTNGTLISLTPNTTVPANASHAVMRLPTDELFVVYVTFAPSLHVVTCSSLHRCRSNDLNFFTFTGQPSLIVRVVMSGGWPLIVWPVGSSLVFVRCTSLDCATYTLVQPEFLPPNGADVSIGADIGVAVGSDGLPIISCYEPGSSPRNQLRFLRCLDVNCTQVTNTPLPPSCLGQASAIGVNNEDLPVVVYYSPADEWVYVYVCGSVTCDPSLPGAPRPVAFAGASYYVSLSMPFAAFVQHSLDNTTNVLLADLRCCFSQPPFCSNSANATCMGDAQWTVQCDNDNLVAANNTITKSVLVRGNLTLLATTRTTFVVSNSTDGVVTVEGSLIIAGGVIVNRE